ncbi:glycosyltransferase family 4 protein [Amycolatopsis thermophila]|uniref:Glycosyltransferase involved in cell wall biosynthesis n=1 Tax=Amycolatopsis thermophila TaxID=206084 RepID=A0ABU0EVV7_9PSEU|nr:glycosyltransferase family 4 protein [Amycolatopsis thermophila]MDQ0379440.1 glycosyltransferase involved in cell wall biosynthesis [Amycolatopsis thermophila]
MERLNVAMVVDNASFGSAEVYIRRLLRFLPPEVAPSLVVSENLAGAFPERVPVQVVPSALGSMWAPQVEAALRALAPDVVHVNLVDAGVNLAAVQAAEAVAPTVATLHRAGGAPAASVVWDCYRRLARAVAPSRVVEAKLRELGTPAERISRVRPGVEIPDAPVRVAERTPVVIGAIGGVTGPDLLPAVAALHRRGRAVRVLVAGDGRDLAERARGLPVRFLGRLRDVSAFLRELDVFCLPSRRDTLSLAVLEAMAHGLPCVTTAVGDAVEELAGAAMIVPPGSADALTAALDLVTTDGALRRKLAEAARARAQRDYDVRQTAASMAATLVAAHAVSSPVR